MGPGQHAGEPGGPDNTVRYHLNKIMQETGKDPRSFRGLTELLSELEEGT